MVDVGRFEVVLSGSDHSEHKTLGAISERASSGQEEEEADFIERHLVWVGWVFEEGVSED